MRMADLIQTTRLKNTYALAEAFPDRVSWEATEKQEKDKGFGVKGRTVICT